MTALAIVTLWVVCGLYAFGTTMAHFDRTGTSRDNLGASVLFAIMGPIGAVVSATCSNFNQYGWHLWQDEYK